MSEVNGLEDVGRFSSEGYSFYTEKDAALAEKERRNVEYLEARLDYSRPDSILRIYNKTIEERVFRSPVGHFFLKNMQNFLREQSGIDADKIADIPMYVTFDSEFRGQPQPVKKRTTSVAAKKEEPRKSGAFTASVVINLVLAAAVIAMFVITLKSDQPNILNYEKAITNRYAAWEQELTEREKAVRVKERELNMQTE